MFSGEALDLTAPYITRQMAYYIEGYAVLGQVYNAYEEVYGAGSLTETRTVMRSNLTGSASPFRLSSEYFSQYRLTFVNKSNSTKIKLSRRLHLESNLGESLRTEYNDIPKSSPAYMTKNPLSASQVKALAAYCKERKMTLFEFLMNKMKFKPYIEFSDMVSYCPFCYDLTRPGTIKPEGDGINKNKICNYSAPPLLRTLRVLRCGRTERFHRLSAPWNRSDPSDKQAYLTGS